MAALCVTYYKGCEGNDIESCLPRIMKFPTESWLANSVFAVRTNKWQSFDWMPLSPRDPIYEFNLRALLSFFWISFLESINNPLISLPAIFQSHFPIDFSL